MIDLNSASDVAQILSVAVPVFAGFFAWKRTLDKRDTEQAKRIALVQLKLDLIEKQFGPNGGGLREAVNNLSRTVAIIDERLIEMMKEHSELVGHVKACPIVKRSTS